MHDNKSPLDLLSLVLKGLIYSVYFYDRSWKAFFLLLFTCMVCGDYITAVYSRPDYTLDTISSHY